MYFSVVDSQSLFRAELPSGRVTHWCVDDTPLCLSVTDAHSLLVVTCREVGRIKEFGSDGDLLREICLPRDVVSPLHAVQLSGDEFVVCHGDDGDPVHRVCLIDSAGQVVRSFGSRRGSGARCLDGPSHLAVDRNGFVFVADLNNDRVLLLSPSLTYIREVLSSDQLKGAPIRLHFDAERSRLYVGVNDWQYDRYSGGHVVVVDI